PQYWRPLSDASVSLDFLLWGWNGGMFHLTNFLLHCIATCLVYFFARRIFSFTAIAACTLAIIFGVSAAHDANLLWIAARADILATIMMLIILLAVNKAERSGTKWIWLCISYTAFFLALCSKEVSAVAIAL